MNQTQASCPLALSFIFKVYPNRNPLKAGSIGIGCTIDRQVKVTAAKSKKNQVFFNGKPINFPTVSYCVSRLTSNPVTISINSPLPLGCGFGVSGASALATAFALYRLFGSSATTPGVAGIQGLPWGVPTEEKLVQIAHIAEIRNKTGLGTVGTQSTRGFLIKQSPGLPVKANRLPFEGKKIYATILGPLETPSILQNSKGLERINLAADRAMGRIGNTPGVAGIQGLPRGGHWLLEDILDISYDFVKESGFLTDRDMIKIIQGIRKSGGHATMAILGRVVLSDIPLSSQSYPTQELIITEDYPKIL